jgi:hypothetical protein
MNGQIESRRGFFRFLGLGAATTVTGVPEFSEDPIVAFVAKDAETAQAIISGGMITAVSVLHEGSTWYDSASNIIRYNGKIVP